MFVNERNVCGDQVVQVYISWRNCPVLMPQLQLVAVSRQLTTVNQPLVVSLTIHAEQMRVWDDAKGFIYIPGKLQFTKEVKIEQKIVDIPIHPLS